MLDYPALRKSIGDKNSASLLHQGARFRRKLRLAFDTQILQNCANERSSIGSRTPLDESWSDHDFGGVETISAQYPLSEELTYIYAICELARRADAEIMQLPSVLAEVQRHANRHTQFHGLERLDFDVRYINYSARCSKMSPVVSRLMSLDTGRCEFDVGDYSPLIEHVRGKKQNGDVVAFIEADIASVDVFLSLDGKFLRPFSQIESKLRDRGVGTRAMSASEFCRVAGLAPIPFPPPNPRQLLGGDTPSR